MNKGFTILELLIVITIVIILVAAMVPLFRISSFEAQKAKVYSDADAIKSAVLLMQADTGTYVTQNQGPGVNVNDPYCLADNARFNCASLPNWNGPYLVWTNDPWGTPYVICGTADVRIVHCSGPNKIGEECGVGDDICRYIEKNVPY